MADWKSILANDFGSIVGRHHGIGADHYPVDGVTASNNSLVALAWMRGV